MQLYVEREIIRRRRAPAFHHSRVRHGIKCRVHLDHFEMLRIPRKPLASRHLFRIPTLDKAGIRPAGRADENFSSFCLGGRSFDHPSTKSHPAAKANKIVILPLASTERMLFRFAQCRYRNYSRNAGWSSLVARQAHNLKAAGSNPAPATKFFDSERFRCATPSSAAIFMRKGSTCPPKIAQGNIHASQPWRKKIQRSSVVESRRSRD